MTEEKKEDLVTMMKEFRNDILNQVKDFGEDFEVTGEEWSTNNQKENKYFEE